ncbi:MAG: DUF2306 domain-containing protein [Phenylobacterium sp.]|uniref:DUF2306 domain-containing protein n=1 Tax=Phenylobacterium sp. TaxID=1871053 RepID=UPI0012155A55|nr:hypothetical protein [Phenylobacterium sp.]TAJ73657.1 MAG: DUF2306 domain-containing protein [Phenylobacterium sp.]
MSPVSQKPARPPMSFGLRFGLSLGAVAVIVGLSLGGAWKGVVAVALAARPHAPDAALFDALSPAIRIHLFTALAALVLGGVLMTARKGRTFHRVAGWVWVSLVLATAGATLFITSLNHGRWSMLHLFTGWVLLVLPLAVMWAKRHDVARHRRTMMGLFYGGFALNLFIAMIPGRTLWLMFLG